MTQAEPEVVDELEAAVDSFEEVRQRAGHVALASFLPEPSHPRYLEIATELVRIDMEYSWGEGSRRKVEDYFGLIPTLREHRSELERVAYEEYRLRVQYGESVDRQEYSSRFAISTASWKQLTPPHVGEPEISQTSLCHTMATAWSDAMDLADDVTAFPECGTEFLGFNLEKELGRGAFAKVFLARQGELADRFVVLKVAAGGSLEPKHLARMQHTNIVPIYSVHQAGRLTAVCMPFLGSRTLADFVRGLLPTNGPPKSGQAFLSTVAAHRDDTQVAVPAGESAAVSPQSGLLHLSNRTQIHRLSQMTYAEAATRLIDQIVQGLLHAHQRGIVHRDLKPANILLTDDGIPLILDFNLSEEIVVNGPAALAVGGTLPYMAPEHLEALLKGGSADLRSDIYSVGVIFYELLTGTQPFPIHRGALESVVEQMIQDREKPLASVTKRVNVSPDLESIVSRCLAPRLQDRYQSVTELHEDLERHLTNMPLAHAPNRSIVERAKKWARRHPRLSSAASVGSLAGIALLLAAWIGLKAAANYSYRDFAARLPLTRAALSIPENDAELIKAGLAATHAALQEYGVNEQAAWRRPLGYWLTDSSDRESLTRELSELAYQMAAGNRRLAHLTKETEYTNEAIAWNGLARSMLSGTQQPTAYRIQQAQLLEAQGDVAKARALRDELDDEEPFGPRDEYLLARQMLTDGRYAEALPKLIKLRSQNPHDPVIWMVLGNAYGETGNLSRADECFSTAIALLPGSYSLLFNRGKTRASLGQFELAIDDFTAALRLKADFRSCLLNRALAEAALGDHAAAVRDYTTALDRGAPYTRIYFLRARSFANLGDAESAAKDRELGLNLVPSDEESWIARGFARLPQEPDAALADFEKALELNPRSVSALQNLVYVYAELLNRPSDALDALNDILEIDPRNADALAGRAVLLARAGEREKAVADLQVLLQISQKPKHLFQAACALSRTSAMEPKDGKRGMRLLDKAIALDPRLAKRAHTDPDLEHIRAERGLVDLGPVEPAGDD